MSTDDYAAEGGDVRYFKNIWLSPTTVLEILGSPFFETLCNILKYLETASNIPNPCKAFLKGFSTFNI